MILVTGASGGIGSTVAGELQRAGAPFKTMFRSEKDAQRSTYADQAVIADFSDKASLIQALNEVEIVYLVCSPIPQLVEYESNMIEAARECKVDHIVLSSALGAGDYPLSFPSWHRKVEDKLKASGLAYTIVRPNGFMQNILTYDAPSIRSQSAFYDHMGEARTSFIDARDIAAVVAKALMNPGDHAGEIYELNGPEAITNGELADRISRVAGRRVEYVVVPEEAQRKTMLGFGMPEWQVEAVLDLQRYYTNGQGGDVTDVLERLLGQRPRTIDEFLEEFKNSFRADNA